MRGGEEGEGRREVLEMQDRGSLEWTLSSTVGLS